MKDVVLEKDDLLAFICEQHKDCITDVEFLFENLRVSKTTLNFDMQTVIRIDTGKRYKVHTQKITWYRKRTLTVTTPCPYTPLTIS